MSNQDLLVVLGVVAVVAGAGIALSVGLAVSGRALRAELSGRAERSGPEAVPPDDTLDQLRRAVEAAEEAATRAGEDTAMFRQVLDALPQGVVVFDEDSKVRHANARATGLLDSQSDVLAARALDEVLSESVGGVPAERTIDLYGPPRRTLTVRTAPIDDGHRSLGVLAVLEDVSELRRLEAVRRDFVANVSHELKTPVGALGLLAETLTDEVDPAVARHLAERIHAESFRVTRIIDDLLDLSRIEAQESPPREPTELNAVIAEAVEGVREMARLRGVSLVVDEPAGVLVVLGDRRQLVSALHNLLENAVKYTDRGTEVSLSVTTGGGSVDLAVADHGMGIPTRDLERIFERFYRVDQGRGRDTGGTGLGLAIVRHVAHNHGGRVRVESREGEGSTFTLRLPLGCAGSRGAGPAETAPADAAEAPADAAEAPASVQVE